MISDPIRRARQAIVCIRASTSGDPPARGTGFLVGGKLALTAYHVVHNRAGERATSIELQFFDGFTTKARWIDGNKAHDYALLECIDDPQRSGLSLSETVSADQRWKAWGWPGSRPDEGLALDGYVVTAAGGSRAAPALQLQCAQATHNFDPRGASGAPCLVDGAVVGILREYLGKGAPVGRSLYATPISIVYKEVGHLLPRAFEPESVPVPELLPLMPNRDAQWDCLRDALAEQLERNPSRPFVMTLLGDDQAEHRGFVQRLAERHLPMFFQQRLGVRAATVKREFVEWNGGRWYRRLEEKYGGTAETLSKQVLGLRTPLIVHTSAHTQKWSRRDAELIRDWFAYWNDWPPCRRGQPLIGILALVYVRRKSWWPPWSRDQMARILDALEIGAANFDQIGKVTLPPLGLIEYEHLDAWLDGYVSDFAEKRRISYFALRDHLEERIRELYADTNGKPMLQVQRALRRALEAGLREIGDHGAAR